jgi:hypothetical protein
MIPYNARSATIGNNMESELTKNLHLRKDPLVVMHHNTDRSNIFLIVERMKHPENSYEDLAFLIKKNLGPGDDSPLKFLVFFNSRVEAQAAAEYLQSRLSPELRDKVKWFYSGMTDEFREDEMNALIIGVRGHPSVSLLHISSPTLHLFICIHPPHLCTILKDHIHSRRLLGPMVRRLPRSRLTKSQ